MDISNAALSVYVSTEVINLAALGIDYILIKDNLPSITEISTKYPVIGAIIILFQMVSPISLGIHLIYYKNNKV